METISVWYKKMIAIFETLKFLAGSGQWYFMLEIHDSVLFHLFYCLLIMHGMLARVVYSVLLPIDFEQNYYVFQLL
jgi:hypothetical protein